MSNSLYQAVYLVLANVSVEDILKIDSLAVSKYECEGIEEYSLNESKVDDVLGDKAYCGGDLPDDLIDTLDKNSNVESRIYFFMGENKEKMALKFKEEVTSSYDEFVLYTKEGEALDWNEEWKKHYKPINVTKNIKVYPNWFMSEENKNDNSIIFIHPGMGFGTGEHETTYLCLKLYDQVAKEIAGKKCLDFGCGSGILGIAASKQHGNLVDFCDIDTNALDNTSQNILLNHEGSTNLGHNLVSRDRFKLQDKYELVFANILEHVLLEEAPLIKEAVNDKGFLIVSGILIEQKSTIIDHYNEFTMLESLDKGDWSAILFQKV